MGDKPISFRDANGNFVSAADVFLLVIHLYQMNFKM